MTFTKEECLSSVSTHLLTGCFRKQLTESVFDNQNKATPINGWRVSRTDSILQKRTNKSSHMSKQIVEGI